MRISVSKINDKHDLYLKVNGAKNSLLHLMFASLLCEKSNFSNVPVDLLDYHGCKSIIQSLGCNVSEKDGNIVNIITKKFTGNENIYLERELTKQTRCSLMLLGSLSKQVKSLKIGYPGGCAFGNTRPFDIHLEGLEKLGAIIVCSKNYITITSGDEKDTIYKLPFASVGATMNLMMYAVVGKSTVILKNIAVEPEIIDVIDFLNKAGGNLSIDSKNRILTIIGVQKLKHCDHEVMPDRIQVLTLVALSLLHRRDVTISKIGNINNISLVLDILKKSGAKIECIKSIDAIKVFGTELKNLHIMDIVCLPYPKFPTDLQPIFSALAVLSESPVHIEDRVYPNRTNYLYELEKLGVKLKIKEDKFIIYPSNKFISNDVESKDLRAGMACMMVASLVENGATILSKADQVYRGYSHMQETIGKFMKIIKL